MHRRNFIRNCCYAAAGTTVLGTALQSCGSIYYATSSITSNRIIVARSEFIKVKKEKRIERKFVMVQPSFSEFPICLFKQGKDEYSASLLECTHRGCEVGVGGEIFVCPCHGAEFSNKGKLLSGPAEEDLKTFRTETDNENIVIILT
ncbi:MAG: Rieske (2Fe-2S) protein [Flavobacteriales bacterium]|nr:Rieske (2Fe-2S) protein [Flavobacteriales bacterium]